MVDAFRKEPGVLMPTENMTGTLHDAMIGVLGAIREQVPFANGDVMSAALHILVDAGMVSVKAGARTKEQLIEEICSGVRESVLTWDEPQVTGGLQ